MDVITTNSGNTLNKILNFVVNFYTTYKNETVYINYGDNKNQVIQLASSNS